jgi:hypothetical protein
MEQCINQDLTLGRLVLQTQGREDEKAKKEQNNDNANCHHSKGYHA